MKKNILFFFFQFALILSVFAQQQRALLIGINSYTPPKGVTPSPPKGREGFHDLEGSKNDALAMQSLIVSKFGFDNKNIDTLFDQQATRKAILDGINDLLSKSAPGDIAFIYYAGHGSEMYNSLSFESDKKDQTIVPNNATWDKTVSDIRDKELSRIFTRFIDKKVKLTVIFDCCHSGSLSRGIDITTSTFRSAPPPTGTSIDAKDDYRPDTIPEMRSGKYFMILSAAQSDEKAAENKDDNKIQHGVFTSALMDAVNQQSVDASAQSIFESVRAIIHNNGYTQEPVIGGNNERLDETLFGMKKGKLSDYSVISVSGKLGSQIEVQGGYAIGLMKENELTSIDRNDTVQLKIDTVTGINTALASVIKGDINSIKGGNRFRVTNWVSSGRPLLKIYVPNTTYTDADIDKLASIANEIRNATNSGIKWVDKPIGKESPDPYTIVFWRDGKCFVKTGITAIQEIKTVTAQNLLKYGKKDSTFYIELPVSKTNGAQYAKRLSENKSFQLVDNANEAHYVLFGKLGVNGLPAYGLRKKEVSASDSMDVMPGMTDCFELPVAGSVNNIPDQLMDRAMKLCKLRGWLNLSVPDGSKKDFPYHLLIEDTVTKQPVLNSRYRVGTKIELKLVADDDIFDHFPLPRYVYVFAITSSGSMVLLYPVGVGSSDNHFPKFINNGDQLVKEVSLTGKRGITVTPGADSYFVLACEQPIEKPQAIFNQVPVLSDAKPRGGGHPLSVLLGMGNDIKTRGIDITPDPTPPSWSLKKYIFTSYY